MLPGYQHSIIADFTKKKAEHLLSTRLIHPTPTNLKEEFLAVCRARFSKLDNVILSPFFKQDLDKESYFKIISRHEVTKFKPLSNFLIGKTNDTDYTNIELLAWLIDFQPRPYDRKKQYEGEINWPANFVEEKQTEENEQQIENLVGNTESFIKIGETVAEEAHQEEQVDAEQPAEMINSTPLPVKKTNTRKIAAIVFPLVILASVAGWYFRSTAKPAVFAARGPEACMFWAGDHFQQVSCSQKLGDTMVIALDTLKLNHLKKITQPDTITRNAIGNVWYIKVNGNLEFYTADGYHPVHREFRLRPITLYMINKYIKPAGQPE